MFSREYIDLPVGYGDFERRNRVRIGVNNAHIGEYEEDGDPTYGSIDAIFRSLSDCGATFVRQPGRYDLLVPPDRSSASGQVALPLGEDLETWVDNTFAAWMATLFTAAREHGIPVVLTFFSLGGGGSLYDVGDPDPGEEYTLNFVVRMDWSLHSGGATITDLLRPTRTYTFGDPASGATGDTDWDEATYDPRDAYKLVYTQHLAWWMGRMLARVARDNGFANAATFDGYLAGIELFNEVNTVNRFEDGSYQRPAELWAEAVAFAVEGFRLAKDDDALPADFPLWWPSLASENADQSFDAYIEPFHAALVDAAKERIERSGRISAAILLNQDTHWYRFTERQVPRPAVEMADVVGGLLDSFGRAGLAATVSVCETGATMTQEPGDPAAYPEYVDAAGDDSAPAASFQAREVVRRIGVAACSGATRVAWHGHMGRTANNVGFAGTGLRVDQGVERARDATTRLSWWTLRRWRQLLWGKQGVIVRPEGAGAFHTLDTSEPTAVLAVLQFQGTRRLPYAWVVFVDSSSEVSEVQVGISAAVGTRVAEVALVPESVVAGSDRSLPDAEFQQDEATFARRVYRMTADDAERFPVFLDADPLLWFTDSPLTFTVSG